LFIKSSKFFDSDYSFCFVIKAFLRPYITKTEFAQHAVQLGADSWFKVSPMVKRFWG